MVLQAQGFQLAEYTMGLTIEPESPVLEKQIKQVSFQVFCGLLVSVPTSCTADDKSFARLQAAVFIKNWFYRDESSPHIQKYKSLPHARSNLSPSVKRGVWSQKIRTVVSFSDEKRRFKALLAIAIINKFLLCLEVPFKSVITCLTLVLQTKEDKSLRDALALVHGLRHKVTQHASCTCANLTNLC